ncbi:hypothetical protein CKM354_000220300 [Cercospora kikuchii]|uniref:(S)-ureidoglycine aminohydrolase cupin domain-containing protein n=1 Tax=Cercospora kikuchii TaxID=84275 RepID=A0A9P3C8U3_9PEZI|nr:uncharacterized protein CKM354_000220300 [Cercospora kikuchii]GIZ38802.1 hypothetical protein CKM354_000220300 [Cercospora kikuchii]
MAQTQTAVQLDAKVGVKGASAPIEPTDNAAQPLAHVVHGGVQCPSPEAWSPFEWEEPGRGKQVHGEVTIFRPFGTTGKLMSGFWRTGPTSPGCKKDGSHVIRYSSPLGDETACVIDGTATLTVLATGKKFHVGPGSIISSPHGLEVEWAIDGPYFKKFWAIFGSGDAATPKVSPPLELQVNHVSDDPPEWTEYHFVEPKEGAQVCGELYFIRDRGSSAATMLSGVWRCGKGIAASHIQDDGTVTTPYTGTLGDETILLLEGQVEVTETASGKKHQFKAGDVIGLTSGMHITWVSKGPFCKKLWVISRDASTA